MLLKGERQKKMAFYVSKAEKCDRERRKLLQIVAVVTRYTEH
jgi:hypothetical protein